MKSNNNAARTTFRESDHEAEWRARVDLAACYRLVAHYGWDDLIFTHISARVPGRQHHFLINPFGMLFEEIRARDLLKVDLEGNLVEPSEYRFNKAGFTIHSAIHAAREDAQCVIHLHTDCGVAVSAQREGLLPISQNALLPYASLGYHDYEGVALREDEKPRLVADLGTKRALMLRNHGTLAVGRSVAEAFLNIFFLERACRIQVLAQSGGAELTRVPPPIIAGIEAAGDEVTNRLGGDLAWPALLRKLDRLDASYRE